MHYDKIIMDTLIMNMNRYYSSSLPTFYPLAFALWMSQSGTFKNNLQLTILLIEHKMATLGTALSAFMS